MRLFFFAENLRFVLQCGMMKKNEKQKKSKKQKSKNKAKKNKVKNNEKRKADGIWEKMQIRKHSDITVQKDR